VEGEEGEEEGEADDLRLVGEGEAAFPGMVVRTISQGR
jgi:hypothetical protein